MSRLDRRSFLLTAGPALAVGVHVTETRASAATQTHRSGELDKLIRRERANILGAMRESAIGAAAVCLLSDGAPVWLEGFGTINGPDSGPVATDTIFSIQSTSKHVTAAAMLIAVQEGLLDLDAPITRYLPDFTVLSRFESKPQERMTLRLLLSHRAGFTHEAPVGNNYESAFPDFEAHVRSISSTWLRYPVGERYRYSNLGYDLAGRALEAATGVRFAEWVQTKLFEPLAMRDSTVATEEYSARQNRAVGQGRPHQEVPLRTPLIPSGGVYTSARDMAAYALFHLNRGVREGHAVLDRTLWDEMHGFSLGGDYGLGVIRSEVRYGGTALRLFSHRGGGFGFGSNLIYCPDAGLAWVAMFNRPASAGYRFGSGLVEELLKQRFGKPAPRLPASDLAAIQPSREQQKRLVGRYVGRNVSAEIRSEGGRLRLIRDGVSAELQLSSPVDLFTADKHGEATTYRYHPALGDQPAHLECSEAEASLDYNGGPEDPPGPDRDGWTAHVGEYTIYQWGLPAEKVTIRREAGFLTLNDVRLVVETEPGLFFTSDGEAVDFRGAIPTWKNLLLQRGAA